MEDFRVVRPAPELAPYIRFYWLLKTAGDAAVARTVPTGMMSLVFHRGRRLLSVRDNVLHPRAFLGGHERTFADLRYDGQVDMIFVMFRPVGVRAFFDLPIDRLAGLRLSAGDLEDADLAALENSLTSTEDDAACIMLIERFLLRRLSRVEGHAIPRVEAALKLINSGETNVAALADVACLGRKQFGRVFAAHVGAHPKEFSRTVRFQRALHTLETNPSIGWAALAADCGYFDQAHMIREFREFSGYTPTEYLALCPPHSDYFS
jgi:AraC-like DNA-binding protein